jgi:hypothetical protein
MENGMDSCTSSSDSIASPDPNRLMIPRMSTHVSPLVPRDSGVSFCSSSNMQSSLRAIPKQQKNALSTALDDEDLKTHRDRLGEASTGSLDEPVVVLELWTGAAATFRRGAIWNKSDADCIWKETR